MLRGECKFRSFEAKFCISRCCFWVVTRRGVTPFPLLPTTHLYTNTVHSCIRHRETVSCTESFVSNTKLAEVKKGIKRLQSRVDSDMAIGWKIAVIPGKSYDFPAHNYTTLVLKSEQPPGSYVWRALSLRIEWFGRGGTADFHQELNVRQSGLYPNSPHIILGLVFRSHPSVRRELGGTVSFP